MAFNTFQDNYKCNGATPQPTLACSLNSSTGPLSAAFIAAYIVVYYVIWFMDDTSRGSWPVLNIHWVLGLLVGFLVLPRLLWRLLNVQPEEVPGSSLEHTLASVAHWGLYGLLVMMPLTGYPAPGPPRISGYSA
jgi:cytochrome b561